MATNGAGGFTEISEKVRVTWPVLLVLVTLTASLVGTYWAARAEVAVHCADTSRHHTNGELRDEFATKEAVGEAFKGMDRTLNDMRDRLVRIETKLDRIEEKGHK
ncbi:MAG: hypothetical protein ACYC63_10910 [Armatimonadota bacterium]